MKKYHLSGAWVIYRWLSANTAVTPLLTHWSYCSLVLSHRYRAIVPGDDTFSSGWEVRFERGVNRHITGLALMSQHSCETKCKNSIFCFIILAWICNSCRSFIPQYSGYKYHQSMNLLCCSYSHNSLDIRLLGWSAEVRAKSSKSATLAASLPCNDLTTSVIPVKSHRHWQQTITNAIITELQDHN